MSQLQYHFGAKYRWYPSDTQKQVVKVNADVRRAFYNHLIANKRKLGWIIHTSYWNGDLKRKIIANYKHTLHESVVRKRISWLRDKYIDSLNFAKTNQSNNLAYKNHASGLQGQPQFHRKKDHPYEWKYQTSRITWKSKGKRKSNIYFTDNRHLVLPVLGRITLGTTRKMPDDTLIGTVTIYKDATDKFWVSLQLASDTPFKSYQPQTHSAIGIDLNICNSLMDNYGHQVSNPKFYTYGLPYLKFLQQRENRRRRYAKSHHINLTVDKGYQRARKRCAKYYGYIKNERRAFLDRISTRLIENHDLIVAENLKSSNILRNHKIAQKASDCGWREFLSMLQYKAKLYGKTVILVNPAYTTQKCSHCGFVCTKHNGYAKKHGKHLDLDDRYWWCPICHTYHIRDRNAAVNILRRGQKEILVKQRQNLIRLKRKRTPQELDSRPNLTFEFHRAAE